MLTTQHQRTISLIGNTSHLELIKKTVMIIGLGAVGGYALENLSRLGIQNLIVVDFDRFEPTNLNRQILATYETLNTSKTISAKNRILQINPTANVTAIDLKLTPDNLDFILNHNPDFIVDAIDDIKTKTALIEFMLKNNLKFISALGAALKYNPELLKTTTLDKTTTCHLAKKLRSNLKTSNLPLNKINVVFSTEPSKITKDENGNNILGSLPFVPMAMGAHIAHFALKTLINKGE
ncbi:MAG: ThiF family adenylyltransferase [Alphaproteobacteria bacterium]|nr:ThiF family adenylyltransferase [Alphaproteobacteria bacterium]